MSDSVRSPRQQPTRLPRPWDSPGKNNGLGCHFLLQCMKVKSESEVAQSCPTLRDPHGVQPTRLLCPWDFPGKRTGVECHCLLRKTILESSKDNLRDETFHSPLTRQLFSFCRVPFTDVGSPGENTPTLVICFFIPYLVIKVPPATYTQIRRHCHWQ